MKPYLRFVLTHARLTIAVLLGVTVILACGIVRLTFDNSFEAFLPQNDSDYLFYNQTKDVYGDNGRFIIMLISHKPLWSAETFRLFNDLVEDLEAYKTYDKAREAARLQTVHKLAATEALDGAHLTAAFADDPSFLRTLKRHLGNLTPDSRLSTRTQHRLLTALEAEDQLKRQQLVDRIICPLTAKDISGEDDTLSTYNLIPEDAKGRRILPRTPADFEILRQKLRRNPVFAKALYAYDDATGAITDFGMVVTFVNTKDQDTIARHLCDLIKSHKQLDIVLHGLPVSNIAFNDYMQRDLTRFLPIVLAVVILVLYFNFRSLRGVVLPMITLCMSLVWVLGIMGYLGASITAVGISLPPLMVAVGSSYAIHILNQYYADFEKITREGLQTGLRRSMAHISFTVFLAGMTTFVAFMTLCTSQVPAIRDWGIYSAVGVCFSVFIACTLIPACIVLLPHRAPKFLQKRQSNPKAVKPTIIDRLPALATTASVSHPKTVLGVVVLVVAFSVAGLMRLKVESDFVQYFKADDPIRVSARVIEKKLAGRWGFNILIDSNAVDGVKRPEFLRTVEAVRQWLTDERNRSLNIGSTYAFSDLIKTMHMAMNNDDQSYYAIPDNSQDILDYLEIYTGEDENGDGRIDDFETYVDPDFRTANIIARLTTKEHYSLGTSQIKRIIAAVDEHLSATLPEPYTHRITGFPMMNVRMAEYIIGGQLRSLLLSFGIIAGIVWLLFRNIKAAPLSLIPMGVAVSISFGIMGWFNINLDIVTSIIAAITIGIGVDDTIHVLNTYRRHRGQGHTMADTITMVLRVSGKAIIFTSLALIAGFSVLTTSSFSPIILFGILMAITMTATTIGALLVLPAVIRMTNVDLTPSRAGLWSLLRGRANQNPQHEQE